MSDLLAAFDRAESAAASRWRAVESRLTEGSHSSGGGGMPASTAGESTISAAVAALQEDEFVLRPLIWDLVSHRIPAAQHGEIRRMMGEKEIEENRQIDREIRALLEIVTGEQIRQAALQQQQQQQAHMAASSVSSSPSSSSSPFTRAALPDSAQRQYLSNEVYHLLASLRSHGMRSGIIDESDDVAKILPRPDTARQRQVMDTMIRAAAAAEETRNQQETTKHTQNQTNPPTQASRPTTAARPSTARQRAKSTGISPDPTARDAITPTAISALSSSILSSDVRPASASDVTSLVSMFRRALRDEHDALLQDVEYLHACLDIEVDQAIQREKQQNKAATTPHKQRAASAGPTTTPSSSSSDSVDSVAPISVQELRDLNAQLKHAVALEEQRSHTLNLMSSVHVGVRAITSAPSSSPFASFAGSTSSRGSTPLKAVRLTSAARSRETSNTNHCTQQAINQQRRNNDGDDDDDDTAPATPTDSRNSSSLTRAAADDDIDLLLAQNADLFSSPASSLVVSPAVSPPTRPVIPPLSLSFGSVALDSSPNRHTDNHHHAIHTPQKERNETDQHTGRQMSTQRTASKMRSRIQAAMEFQQE